MGLLETGHSGEVLRGIKRNFVDGHVSYVYEAVLALFSISGFTDELRVQAAEREDVLLLE